jgi:hypothetical protein
LFNNTGVPQSGTRFALLLLPAASSAPADSVASGLV